MMRKALILVSCLSACGTADEGPKAADLADPALQACVNQQMGFADDSRIRLDTAQELRHLDCIDRGIQSLKGLENYRSLETLSVWENNISDISALRGLTNLRWLELGANDIADISALNGLTGLTRLGISSNEITDISSLAGLGNLEWLTMDDNQISSVDDLSGLDGLRWVTADHNDIGDASVLEDISNNGAEVYADYQQRGAEGPPAPPSDDTSTSGRIEASVGTLLPWNKDNGDLAFDLAVGRSTHSVRSEFDGNLYIEDTTIWLETSGQRILVGTSDGATAQICENGEACSVALGVKTGPPLAYDGLAPEPIVSMALNVHAMPNLEEEEEVYGASDVGLIDYVLASPNQLDAGSCLFMTTTGAMELLIHQHTDMSSVEYDGDTDLSERFLMAAYQDVPSDDMRWWLTDTLYTYNHFGGSMLNRDYPFTAGYVRETSSGSVVPCDSGDDGAYISCSYNWFDERPSDWDEQLVDTPPVERTIAFADPDQDSDTQWNVGLMDDDDVEKIKYMLRTRQAPVVVIYNHYLYWHADIIVGYDDTVATNGCPMVDDSMDYFDEKGAGAYNRKIEAHMNEIGDCTSEGVFYVRDSIYEGGDSEVSYDYGRFSEKYSERIIERTYNWVKFLGNHAYAIHRN